MTAIELKVSRIEDAAEAIRAVTLEPLGDAALPGYEAGAHVEVDLPDGATRPYSLVDLSGACAKPDVYRLGIRLEPESRGGSRYMHGLAEGDVVRVSAPKNDFPLAGGDAPALLIAGGIGITPIVTMAGAAKAAGRDYRLVYAVRNAAAAAFAEALAEAHGDALTLHRDDAAGGPLDVTAVLAEAPEGAHVHVCGPKPMIEAVKAAAHAADWAADRVHFELFDAAADQAGDTAFEVEIASSGKVYTIPPGKSIIDVLEEAGEDLIYDCQRGDCGICQTEVLEGVPDHRDVVLSPEERERGTLMQICVSRAKTPRLKLDL
ncbi:PDR/VanB family oxidoreductase [Roseivivax sp. CAU 1761]